ncbi:MAG: hypothetical protein AABY54_09650 [Deltaproteobacteria bacterium]
MIRYLIIFAFIYIVYRMIRSLIARPADIHDTAKTPIGTDMVKDPNCNTYIPLKSAIVGNVKGKSHYFCSKECEKEYSNK